MSGIEPRTDICIFKGSIGVFMVGKILMGTCAAVILSACTSTTKATKDEQAKSAAKEGANKSEM
jgi:hypothetical protein